MRVFLLALMIALLPVRGWVGNAMAVDMAAQSAATVQAASLNPLANMPEDCPMHAQQSGTADTADQQGGPATAQCKGCDTCQLCLALAAITWINLPDSPFVPNATLQDSGNRFSSADRLPGVKPPIS